MTDQERISKLEQRVDRLEDIIKNLSHTTENLFVGATKDQCNMHLTLRHYIKEYCDDFESDEDKKCKTCRYYLYAFEGFPCIHCKRNFTLADEIREQQNDRWKDGTPNG